MGELQPWQQRLLEEKQQLDDNIEKLAAFLADMDAVKEASMEQISLMNQQLGAQRYLSELLGKRIALFN